VGLALSEAAMRYVGLGLAVIPLHPKSKKPVFEDWTSIQRADTGTVQKWWHNNPNANIGILTGPKSGVFVLDVDTKDHGEITFDSLTMEHGRFPETWQQVTGTGGFHLFFRYPNFPVHNVRSLFPGIDIRGEGGQVVAPPSVHPDTGKTYEWDGIQDIEKQPIAEAPMWLLEILQARNQSKGKPAAQVPAKIPAGVRHPTLLSIAGMLRRLGLDQDEIYPTLRAVNDRRCDPPKDDREVRGIAESIIRYRPVDHNLYSTATALWRLKGKAQAEQDRRTEKLKTTSMDGLSVYRSELSGPPDIIERMLYNGLTIMAGRAKAGKSFLALQLAISVALGTQALGGRKVTRPGGVVYYSLEMGENRTADRMRKLLEHEQIALQNLDFIWDCLPMNSGGMEQMDLLLDMKKPNLVVIDTFLGFVKGQAKDGGDILRDQYSEIERVKKLADKHDTAMLLVHHTRKGNKADAADAGVELVAGTTGVTAACDSVWIFRKQAEESFVLDITGRDVEEQSLAMKFDRNPMGWKIIGDAADVRLANEEMDVLKILVADGAITASKVASRLRVGHTKALDILSRLDRDGRVVRQVSGTYRAIMRANE
jgi:Bifunctional DNA primase/polymerase, N-terminal/AAA domain/Primase C terminal 1 (PriCT-1)